MRWILALILVTLATSSSQARERRVLNWLRGHRPVAHQQAPPPVFQGPAVTAIRQSCQGGVCR